MNRFIGHTGHSTVEKLRINSFKSWKQFQRIKKLYIIILKNIYFS